MAFVEFVDVHKIYHMGEVDVDTMVAPDSLRRSERGRGARLMLDLV